MESIPERQISRRRESSQISSRATRKRIWERRKWAHRVDTKLATLSPDRDRAHPQVVKNEELLLEYRDRDQNRRIRPAKHRLKTIADTIGENLCKFSFLQSFTGEFCPRDQSDKEC